MPLLTSSGYDDRVKVCTITTSSYKSASAFTMRMTIRMGYLSCYGAPPHLCIEVLMLSLFRSRVYSCIKFKINFVPLNWDTWYSLSSVKWQWDECQIEPVETLGNRAHPTDMRRSWQSRVPDSHPGIARVNSRHSTSFEWTDQRKLLLAHSQHHGPFLDQHRTQVNVLGFQACANLHDGQFHPGGVCRDIRGMNLNDGLVPICCKCLMKLIPRYAWPRQRATGITRLHHNAFWHRPARSIHVDLRRSLWLLLSTRLWRASQFVLRIRLWLEILLTLSWITVLQIIAAITTFITGTKTIGSQKYISVHIVAKKGATRGKEQENYQETSHPQGIEGIGLDRHDHLRAVRTRARQLGGAMPNVSSVKRQVECYQW